MVKNYKIYRELTGIKRLLWINATLSWYTMAFCAVILVSIYIDHTIIQAIMFLIITLAAYLYWNAYDNKIRGFL